MRRELCGTLKGYLLGGCRCEPCTVRFEEADQQGGRAKGHPTHGFTVGCGCAHCRDFALEAGRRARRAQL